MADSESVHHKLLEAIDKKLDVTPKFTGSATDDKAVITLRTTGPPTGVPAGGT